MATELSRYLRHCRDVVRDIDHVIADHMLQTKDGWKIHYAVDFSEIYGFTFPFKDPEVSLLADGWQEDALRQYHGITRFFSRKNIVLLEPYVVELYSHLESLLGKYYDASADLLLLAMKDLRKILDAQDATNVEVMTLKAYASKTALTPGEAGRVIRFFEAQAPALVAFVRGVELPPLAKLKRLMATRPFIDLDDIAPGTTQRVSRETVQRLTSYLATGRHRRATSDRNDALAMEQIRVANRELEKKKEKLLLVSRSAGMARAISEHAAELRMKPFIRHPRIFSAAYSPPGGLDDSKIADLKLRRESLQLFIDAAQKALSQPQNVNSESVAISRPLSTEQLRLKQSLQRIKDGWGNAEGLSTPFAAEGEGDLLRYNSVDKDAHDIAKELLDYLRDRAGNICEYALKHIRQIFDDVRHERDRLSAKIESAAAERQPGNILFIIEFHNPDLRDRMEELAEQWSVSVEDAASLLEIAAAKCNDDYEQLLAMAVSLGIIGQWPGAEKYTAYALHAGKRDQSLHEGHFWHAICVRKNTQKGEPTKDSVERIRRAIAEIEVARSAKCAVVGDSPDPRYLKEEAALMIEWRQIARSPSTPSLLADAPSPERIAKKLETALEATQDAKLIVQIRNATCYLYLEENDLTKAAEALTLLQETLKPYPVVPSFIRDTIIWAQFKLTLAKASVDEIQGFLADFETIRNSPDLTPFDKKLVQEHRNAVSEFLRTKKIAEFPV